VWFSDTHHWGVIVGCTLFYIAAGILTPGSIAFGIMLAKIEGRWPLWSLTTAVCGVFISLIIFFNACAWIVSAYRKTGADVSQAFQRLGAYITLTTGYMLRELRRAPERPEIPAPAGEPS
jgi:hypothetical protein